MRRRSFLIVLGLALACTASVASVPTGPPVVAAPGSLADRANAALRRTAHRSVRYSVAVWDATSGERLFARNAGTLRRTASAMKLATTGAALLALGADHQLTLEIRASRPAENGVLRGNLLVEGTGYPGFSEHLAEGGASAALAALAALAREVRAAGVESVEGDLLLDNSAFPGPSRHPDWGWKPGKLSAYMAPVTALTVNDGCVDVTAFPGAAAGDRGRLRIAPPGVPLTFVPELTTTADEKKHSVHIHAPDDEGRVRVSGRVLRGSGGFTTSVACVDPPLLLGHTLAHALREAGVRISGDVRVVHGPPAAPWPRPAVRPGVVLARRASTLSDVIAVTNRRSQNLFAELILRNLGLHADGDASFEGGCRVVRRTLELGADFEQEDGSGLSRGNRATVGALGGILLRMYDSEHRIVFMTSLAEGGDPEGTLRKRFREKRFRGRVLAKTGTLRDTKALAGYVRATGGRVLAFAILCEGVNWRATNLQNEVVGALVDG